jgi:ADP-heptose:LPS heptosyltransferase
MLAEPKDILLIKAHSMGIGDLLRSTAAWRALKQRWPQTNLHLLMLKKQDLPATEHFIGSHHLLSHATFVRSKIDQDNGKQSRVPFSALLKQVKLQLQGQAYDLVIDCEPYGLTTAMLARQLARRHNATAVGIAQFPLRKYFYDLVSPSTKNYQRSHHLNTPLDYTERDFVALASLGITRQTTRIELKLSTQALLWQKLNGSQFESNLKQLVLNIGCGTQDALIKRPPLQPLLDAMTALYQREPFALHLSGAEYEKDVNDEFIRLFASGTTQTATACTMMNWAGKCTLDELAGLISNADMMISSDSGPYHMAVALGVPTICWFNFLTPASHHAYNDVALLTSPSPEQFVDAAVQLSQPRDYK